MCLLPQCKGISVGAGVVFLRVLDPLPPLGWVPLRVIWCGAFRVGPSAPAETKPRVKEPAAQGHPGVEGSRERRDWEAVHPSG